MIIFTLSDSKSWAERLTAVNVAGRNRIVTAAMTRMAALSLAVARATVLESSAIALMAMLSCRLASAMRLEASVISILTELSRCATRL